MTERSGGVFKSLYGLVKAFLRDFYTESKKGTLRHKKGIAIFLSFVFLCFVVIVVGLFKLSETPFFCGLCHNMKVYVDSWKASKHRDVSCIKCHYKPGLANHLKGKWQDGQLSLVYFVTGKSPTKPHAEIDDASCLQCHKRSDLKNEMVFKNVLFSHPRHIEQMRRQKQLRCTTCHSQIVQGAHMTVTDVECFICHFYKTKDQKGFATGCNTCHFEARGDIAVTPTFTFNHKRYIARGIRCEQCHTNVVSGDGHIPEFACLQCHNKRSILEAKYTPEFLHTNHVTNHKVECFTCHSPIKHQISGLHYRGQTARACADCHSGELHENEVAMYLGKGARLAPERPNRMAAINMDCNVCHQQGPGSPASMSCKQCHGNLTEGMLKGWKTTLQTGEDALSQAIAAAKASPGEKGSTTLKRTIEDAQFNYDFLKKGNGIHNIVYAMSVIETTRAALKSAGGGTIKPTEKSEGERVSCLLCHNGIEQKKVPFGSVSFPHAVHSGGEGWCLTCHTPYDNHGKTTLKGCSNCHHGAGSGKVQCSDCHKGKQAMFDGKGIRGMAKSPDAMAGKVSCSQCHKAVKQGKKGSVESIKAACVSCHSKDYAGLADDWIAADKNVRSKYTAVLADFQRELSELERKTGRHSVPLRARYDEMDDNVRFLLDGGLYHNPQYSDAITAKTDKDAKVLQSMVNEAKAGKPIIPKK
jgi:hypothetical protein